MKRLKTRLCSKDFQKFLMIYRHRTSVRWNRLAAVVSICVTFRVRFEKDKEFTERCVEGINKSAFVVECVKRPRLLVGIINALSRPCDELDSLEHSLQRDC